MDYPPTPTDPFYVGAYPQVALRPVPTTGEDHTLNQSRSALRPGNHRAKGVTLAPPVRIEFGVTRLWVSDGQRRSRSFHDGAIPVEQEDAVDDLNFVPGQDEDKLTVRWELHTNKPGYPKGAKLELFARGAQDPIWTQTFGPSFGGDAPKAVEDLLGEEKEAVREGSLPFADVKPEGQAAFPDGLLTLAGSPYQLRLTVSGRAGADPKLSGDKYAYPMTAWTYVHVLAHSIEVRWGDMDWLERARPDIDPAYQAKVLGAVGGAPGYERDLFQAMKDAEASPKADVWHEVVLPANQFARAYNQKDEVETNVDHKELAKHWGHGPRIPLVAEVKLRDAAGEAAQDVDPRVFTGAKVLWDWRDPQPDRWKSDHTPTKPSEAFLQSVFAEGEALAPRGSTNCPKKYGGKLGDEAGSPVFPPDVPGPFPYRVTRCGKRTWGALSEFADAAGEQKGTTGVVFQPSRMAGDKFEVRAALYFDDRIDTADDLDLPAPVVGSPGTFEVLHRVDLYHVVVGDLPNVDVDGCREKARKVFRTQARALLNVTEVAVPVAKFRDYVKKVIADGFKDENAFGDTSSMAFGYPDHFALNAMTLDDAGAKGLVPFRDADAAADRARTLIRDGALFMYELHRPEPSLVAKRERLVGQNTGGVGYPLTDVGGYPRQLILFEAGKPVIRDGEQVKGALNGLNFIKLLPAKCCTGTGVTLVDGTSDRKVTVTFPGLPAVDLEYSNKSFGRGRKVDLSDRKKRLLREKLVEAGKAFADSTQKFEVRVEHSAGDDACKRRREQVKAYLEEELKKKDVIIDKALVLEALEKQAASHRWTGFAAKDYGSTIRARACRDALIFPAAARMAADEKWHEKPGVYMFHFVGYSNLAYLDKAQTAFGQKATLLGAYDPNREFTPNDRSHGFISLITPDPQHASTAGTDGPLPDIFAHEVGHSRWLPHAPAVTGKANPASTKPAAHVKNDVCLMNYDVEERSFCGLCILRLRGWDWSKAKHDAGALEFKVELALGDVDAGLFLFGADTRAGQMARLQVLGLFNRPLGRDSIGKEEAFDVCWEYAKTLFPGLDGDPKGVLSEKIKEFLIDGGALPAEGKLVKARAPGGFTPVFSMSDLMHRYPHHHAGDEPNPEDAYALGAERGAYEDHLYRENAALGTIPLEVTVKARLKGSNDDWRPAPDFEVFVGLTRPDPAKGFGAKTDGVAFSGGKTFVLTADAPYLAEKPKAFITAKVDGYKKGDSGDPQSGNVHADLGGKRGRHPDGNVGASGGVFCASRADGFSPLQPVGDLGIAVPHAVPVRTDDQGVARLAFRPSRIGGDRYKLEAFVAVRGENKAVRLAEVKTGTIVRWRAVRVCHYFQHSPPASAAALSQEFKDLVKKQEDLPKLVAPLERIDFGRRINDELAKAYCQLIVDPGAQAPNAIPAQAWTDLETELDVDLAAYSDTINNPSLMGKATLPIYEHKLAPENDERKTFKGTLPVKRPGPGTVTVRFVGKPITESVAHDFLAEDEDPPGDGYNLRALKKGDKILGRKDRTKSNDGIAVKGKVNYDTGEVQVEFEAKQEAEVQVNFAPDQYIDFKALYNFAATDLPGLLRLNLPRAYNALVGADYLPMEEGEQPKQSTFLTDRIYSPSVFAFVGALFRALGGNKQGCLPGLIVVQADRVDPYDALYVGMQEGKGVANGVLVFRPADGDLQQLALHEMSHALFLMHAPPDPPGSPAHLHDPADDACVMSYSTKRDGDYCGMCVANLRGIYVERPPLKLPKKALGTGHIVIELVDEQGVPQAGVEFQVLHQGRPIHEGETNELGKARVDGLPTGTVKVTFPGLHGPEWDKA
ncbi:MAG: hypothetical protein KF878_21585 [Planctomycetes bacterium]|nr:hypothetical protein [Planctomycetota bacterium]